MDMLAQQILAMQEELEEVNKPERVIPCQICMKILDPFKNVIFVSYHHN